MKYRLDQVTNSSSSSYVCDVCNNVEAGYELSLSGAEMYECVNGHKICESHVDLPSDKEVAIMLLNDRIKYIERATWYKPHQKTEKIEGINELLKKIDCEEYDDFEEIFSDYSLRSSLPAELCPICNHEHINDSEALEFALGMLGMTEEELKDELRKQFKEQK